MTAAARPAGRLRTRWRQAGPDVRRFWVLAAAGTAVALALRVAWAIWAAREPTAIFVDQSRYLGYARQIADGNGMVEPFSGRPTAYYPPGYPWFLGIVVWAARPFTDDVVQVAGLVQAVLGACTALFAGLVARRLAGWRAGVVAVFALALYPNLITHTGTLLGETLFNFLFVGFLAVVLARPADELTYRRVAAAGVVLGLAVMVRPISLPVVGVVALCWWLARRDLRQVAAWTGVLLAGVAACVLPWTIRNAIRMDAFVPISTNTGDNLCIGHGHDATGAFTIRERCNVPYRIIDGPAAEVAGDDAKTSIALRSIADAPGQEPWLLWRRFYFIWVRSGDHDGVIAVQSYRQDRWMDPVLEADISRVSDRTYWPVLAAGLVGAGLLVRRRRPEDLVLVGSALVTALVPLAFFGDSRFKVPVLPLLIIAAATLVGPRGRPEPDGALDEVDEVDEVDGAPTA